MDKPMSNDEANQHRLTAHEIISRLCESEQLLALQLIQAQLGRAIKVLADKHASKQETPNGQG